MRKKTMKGLMIAIILGMAMMTGGTIVQAGPLDVAGCWRTISDETGKITSKVCIWENKGKLYGQIKELYKDPDDLCTKCTSPATKDKPIKGMTILWGLTKGDGAWENGYWLDPTTGKSYKCKLWKEGGKIKIRGSIGFINRTQTWIK